MTLDERALTLSFFSLPSAHRLTIKLSPNFQTSFPLDILYLKLNQFIHQPNTLRSRHSATWCGPCKTIGPEILALSNTLLDVLFLKVDVDENDVIASEYEINAMPTFAFVKNKKLIESFSGARIDKVKELITKHKG